MAKRQQLRIHQNPHRLFGGTVKLTKSWSIYPQDTGLEPVVNPPYWASETAISLNLTIPPEHRSAEPVWREIGVYVQLGKTFDVAVGDREQVTQRDLDSQRPESLLTPPMARSHTWRRGH